MESGEDGEILSPSRPTTSVTAEKKDLDLDDESEGEREKEREGVKDNEN